MNVKKIETVSALFDELVVSYLSLEGEYELAALRIAELQEELAMYKKVKKPPVGEDTRLKDRVKLGVSPSTEVSELEVSDE